MNYYQHHIGDFIRDTAQLGDVECMAYLRLIWIYYESESPLPNNLRVLSFRTGADQEAIGLILESFFVKKGDMWRHNRCDEEIAEYNVIRERNKANGMRGGRPNKTQQKPTGFPVDTRSEPSCNPNQEPVTSNQELTTTTLALCSSPKRESVPELPRGFAEFYAAYPRKKSKHTAIRAWQKISPNEQTRTAIMAGLSRATTSADWLRDGGKFVPYPASWLNAGGWQDDTAPMLTVVSMRGVI